MARQELKRKRKKERKRRTDRRLGTEGMQPGGQGRLRETRAQAVLVEGKAGMDRSASGS